jgi:hypothetical protein
MPYGHKAFRYDFFIDIISLREMEAAGLEIKKGFERMLKKIGGFIMLVRSFLSNN